MSDRQANSWEYIRTIVMQLVCYKIKRHSQTCMHGLDQAINKTAAVGELW